MASGSWKQSQELGPNKVRVTILASEWGSSKGGISTINRELAVQLAKFPEVQITYFLLKCSEEDRKVALMHGITILKATRQPGYEELNWLSFPPEDLRMEVIVGHGVKLGRQARVIRNSRKCKWIQMVHTDPEELAMFKCYENPISKGEEKHNVEVELCMMADFVVAVGPKLAEAFRNYLRSCQKDQDVIDFTPGIFDEFVSVKQVREERKQNIVLVFGRGDAEDFELKGFDIAARSVAALPDTRLVVVGAPDLKHEEIASRLLECGILKRHLRVKGYIESRESLKRLFCTVDLVIMPSRAEGFGLTGLEALSAGLPVIVSKNSGFGEALGNVPFGSSFVIDSEDPSVWTAAIKDIWNKKKEIRLDEAEALRDSYGRKYSWWEQCKDLLKKMINSVNGRTSIEVAAAEATSAPDSVTLPFNKVAPSTLPSQNSLWEGMQAKGSKSLESLAYDLSNSVDKIFQRLDTRIQGTGRYDYEIIGSHFGYDHFEIKSMFERCDGSPSRAMLQAIAVCHPELTVEEFARVVEAETPRKDVVQLLRAYDRVSPKESV